MEADPNSVEEQARKHWEVAVWGFRRFQRGEELTEEEKVALKSVDKTTFQAIMAGPWKEDFLKLETAGFI